MNKKHIRIFFEIEITREYKCKYLLYIVLYRVEENACDFRLNL